MEAIPQKKTSWKIKHIKFKKKTQKTIKWNILTISLKVHGFKFICPCTDYFLNISLGFYILSILDRINFQVIIDMTSNAFLLIMELGLMTWSWDVLLRSRDITCVKMTYATIKLAYIITK